MAGGPDPVAQRAGSLDRRAVRQRAACRDPGVRRGDPDLDPEKSIGVEASIRKHGGPAEADDGLLHPLLNFIFQAATGVEDDLPVYRYLQGKADYGFEVEANAELGNARASIGTRDFIADYVHAKVEDFGPAPQIPPLRLLGGISANGGPVEGRLEVEHAFRETRNAPLETETDGYTMVNASVDWKPLDGKDLTLGIAANNIFDVVARRHSSLLDYARALAATSG